MKIVKTFESYNEQSEFFSQVIDILKQKSTTPVDINQIIEFYKNQIIDYFDTGKSPENFVSDFLSDLESGSDGVIGVKFPKNWSGDIKYL